MMTPIIHTSPLEIARRFIGLKEVPGAVANPAILAMLQMDAKWPTDDATPWCSAFANLIAHIANVPRSRSLAARSWLKVGAEIPTLELARPGFDVVVFKSSVDAPGPEVLEASGHVAFFVGYDGKRVMVLGGNQSDSVNISSFSPDLVLQTRRLI